MQNRKVRVNSPDLVRDYLREIGRIRLLTREEEIDYSRAVQKAMALKQAKEALNEQLQREPTKREWADYIGISVTQLLQILHQGERAKDKMIKANLRLVVSVAKKYQKHGLEFLDLIQEGTMGLERGVEKFDPKRGYKFSTYAYWWIRQGITRAIAQQARTIRLPIHITEKLSKIKKVQRELTQKLGCNPSLTELSNELNMSPERVRYYLLHDQNPISLDLQVGEDLETSLGNLVKDATATNAATDYVMTSLLRDDLDGLIAELPPQEKKVLSLRFGLADGNARSLAEIGRLLNLSRERVRQIEHKGLMTLRKQKARLADWC